MPEKKNIKMVFQIMGIVIVALVLIFILGSFIVAWIFTDKEFRHGDLLYWLCTDQQVRSFPIVGAEESEIVYISKVGDGNHAPYLILIYKSHALPEEIIKKYQKFCRDSNYKVFSKDLQSADYLRYIGKGKYEIIGISIFPISNYSEVRLSFEEKFE